MVGKPLEVSSTISMTSSELTESGLANGSATVRLNSEDLPLASVALMVTGYVSPLFPVQAVIGIDASHSLLVGVVVFTF